MTASGSPLSISVEGVSKAYTKYLDTPLLIGHLLQLRSRSTRERFLALRDIDLAVQPGEFLGVIGRNGSGKSTLLRLLAGVSAPTEGRVTVRGRIAPLIAVGVGFHPELTGRENVFVNGAILGLRRAEVAARLDEIVAFAELEDFVDTPVKFYSSGMFVRLGFAASVLAEPDVLLVDEVLAVGDIAFQLKCFERMEQLRAAGTTVVVVSHNLTAIRRLCDRAIVLHDGTLRLDGQPGDAITLHQDLLLDPSDTGDHPLARADLEVFELLDEQGRSARRVDAGTPVTARAVVRLRAPLDALVLNIAIESDSGQLVYAETTPWDETAAAPPAGGRIEVRVRFTPSLPEGGYSVRVVLADHRGAPICRVAGPSQLHVNGRPRVRGLADLGATFAVTDAAAPGGTIAGR